MTVSVCIDASVAVKWVLPEAGSDIAATAYRDFRRDGYRLLAPRHLSSEVPSALYKRIRTGALALERAHRILIAFDSLPIEYSAPSDLATRALTIAATHNLKWIYDAYYVALAEIAACDLWTADATLHHTLRGHYPNIRLLSEYAAPDA